MIKPFFILLSSLAGLASLGSLCLAEPERPIERPNILFIFSDDHATDAIGAYDGRLKSVNPTPAIDKLAAQGMVMRNSFCTNSICGPSRAAILSGKHSHKNGFMNNGNSFDWNQQTFPKLLQKPATKPLFMVKLTSKEPRKVSTTGPCCRGRGIIINPILFFRMASG